MTQAAQTPTAKPSVELWAGIECTVNRVGDRFFDQIERNGHDRRIEDLEQFAALGVKAIRYPVLWEKIAPDGVELADWSWTDERLNRLRELGIRPIAGLVHHGSGPAHTCLTDPLFAEKLAEFARAVAMRYPWLDAYTPVNEPLTTARFSGLYGHWYPHGQDDKTFLGALLNECRAVILSMQAIRDINPKAQLIQTEDLGKIFSTPLLSYQAEFENERRWLSFDLLCGRVDHHHPLWDYLLNVGISAAELDWFTANPCSPDVFGINHYMTSDRFLDERLDRYPSQTHGGNGRHQYADVEAVRVCADGIPTPKELLREVWERYQGTGSPTGAPTSIAVTEVHLGCTREEQLRWLKEVWEDAQALQQEGVPVQAVTVWSLLGAYDWNTLLTRREGFYEPGVFDLRAPAPRPTALAMMMRYFAEGRTYQHPLLEIPGWWKRDHRLLYPPVNCKASSKASEPLQTVSTRLDTAAPVLITGATGTLGRAFARLCEIRGIPYRLLSRREMDITQTESVDRVLADLKPWAVINTAGYVRVDAAEQEPHVCRQINAEGAAILAQACVQHNISYVTFSSDLVFDGNQSYPYLESHDVAPLNVYGHSKATAEQWVLSAHPCALVIRTSAFFGPWDEYNFLTLALRTLAAGQPFIAAEDAIVSPTYVPDLVNTTLDLMIDGECGLWHLANPGAITWADLARQVAEMAGMPTNYIEARPTEHLGFAATRPMYSALSSERGILLPTLDRAIVRYLADCELVQR
ncbi:family 1 glycosylhydrolase [Leptolyngbya ohadii]|uniref:family 1 glycosylhydrolase n=1 Tax=Leptolyngbya ohadii TaxID=1962290 RepID=UPI000B59B4F2|nr:family 1 glycosylhydrolase [Leptolyngbya ohadii]